MTHTDINAVIEKVNKRLRWANLTPQQLVTKEDQHLKTAAMETLQENFRKLMGIFYYETPARGYVCYPHYNNPTYNAIMGECPQYPIPYVKGRTSYRRKTPEYVHFTHVPPYLQDVDYSDNFIAVQTTTPEGWIKEEDNQVSASWQRILDRISNTTDLLKWIPILPSEMKTVTHSIMYDISGNLMYDTTTTSTSNPYYDFSESSSVYVPPFYQNSIGDVGTAGQPSTEQSASLQNYQDYTQARTQARFYNAHPWRILIRIYYIVLPFLHNEGYLMADFAGSDTHSLSISYTPSAVTGSGYANLTAMFNATVNSFANFQSFTQDMVVQPNSFSPYFGPTSFGDYHVNTRIQDFRQYNQIVAPGQPDFMYGSCAFGQVWHLVAQYRELETGESI